MQEAKRYESLRIRLALLQFLIEAGYFLFVYFSHFSLLLQNLIAGFFSLPSLQIAFYVILLLGLIEIITFPLSLWRGWLLPRHFLLSNQRLTEWLKDYLKVLLLSSFLAIFFIEFFYLFIQLSPGLWWLLFTLFLIVFLILMARLTPILLLPIFIKSAPLKDEEIKYRLESLSQQVFGIRMPVYEMNLSEKTRGATAMLAGFGRTRRIYLADTLLKNFSPDEIYVVSAHEFAHHYFRHLWKVISLQSGILFLTFGLLKFISANLGVAFAIEQLANLPLIITLTAAIFICFMLPLNSILRRWELKADAFAVRITKLPQPFISALNRLAELNLANPEPSSLIEHLFYSHPSIKKRIESLSKFNLNN